MTSTYDIAPNGANDQTELGALRGLLEEMIGKTAPVEPVRTTVTYRSDIAAMACKELVQRIIRERGEQAAAILATKLNAELARRGKVRVKLQRVARNGNGNGVHVHG
jgi:hypothetical protein